MLNVLVNLPDNPRELKGLVTLLSKEVQALSLKVEQLQHQLHGANRHRFGTRSENLEQLLLTLEHQEVLAASVPEENDSVVTQEERTKPKRWSLPESLQRNTQVLEPGDECAR
ncbi:transposase [Flexibacterium corallicola]|uniref:transposase n=1 Tax=Flexibacterium corallicola TaxID=3037259 RepID=UPI00286F5D3C|nr:transposase [Pseudovibrio sp. M1P-2-3]